MSETSTHMKVLHLDTNHSLLINQLAELGCINHENYSDSKEAVQAIIHMYDGIIIRSRFTIDKEFIDKAANLKFIGRVGAGLENIDVEYAHSKGIKLIAAPEGNRNAVGEHTLGMLLALMNRFKKANKEIKNGKWLREENRGWELEGRTVGIIGYGNMGKAFARKLRGFDIEILCYDIKEGVGDVNARQVSLEEFRHKVDVVSLHTPQTTDTEGMINGDFINAFSKPFWFINTARGKSVVTKDLVKALKKGKVLGAGLDVLEYEKSSFEDFFTDKVLPKPFKYLLKAENVILTPLLPDGA